MALDIRTIIVVGAALCAVMGILVSLSSRDFPTREHANLRIWTGSLMLLPLAWGLFAARGAISDLLSIVAANGLLVLALAENTRAIRRYLGVAERRWALWSMPAAATVAAWAMSVPYAHYSGRVIAVSLAGAVLLGLAAAPLLHAARSRGSAPAWMLFVLCALGVMALLARLTVHLLAPDAQGRLFDAGPIDAVGMAYGALSPVFMAFAFLLMYHERAYRHVHALATTDSLTGALSRGATEDLAARLIDEAGARGTPLALAMLDVDRFKRINDSHGHPAGDEVLREVAARIAEQLRASDSLGRIGGEEFLVLLPGARMRNALIVAERIRTALRAQPIRCGEALLQVTASLGVTEWRRDEATLEPALLRADRALYAAKRGGRDRVEAWSEPHWSETGSGTDADDATAAPPHPDARPDGSEGDPPHASDAPARH